LIKKKPYLLLEIKTKGMNKKGKKKKKRNSAHFLLPILSLF